LMAEVYNPKEYRNYIKLGKMDYLYDKVETYDYLKSIIQGKTAPDGLTSIAQNMSDIEHHMLHFLDNHDEQRLACQDFAGTPEKGKPLMVYSATVGTAPTMIYFGQEVGEAGTVDGGFGKPTRTSIFDYVGVPNHQRWMNGGKFDGGLLSDSEKELRDFYQRLLNFNLKSDALMGIFHEIQSINRKETSNYDPGIYSYLRYSAKEKLILVINFSWLTTSHFDLKIPADVIEQWKLKDGTYPLKEQLYGTASELKVKDGVGTVSLSIKPSESLIFKL